MPFDGKTYSPAPRQPQRGRSRILLAGMIAVTAAAWLVGSLIGPPEAFAERALAIGHWLFGFAAPAIAVIWLANWEPPSRDGR